MKRVIKMSKAWIAAFVTVILLTGCDIQFLSDSGSQEVSGTYSAEDQSGTVTVQDKDSQQADAVERTAVLSWNAPLQRQNNESLSMAELSGYVINYGQDPENLDQVVEVNDAHTMEHTVEGLSEGTWYFSVQAEDNDGLMSPPSDLVSKTIQS